MAGGVALAGRRAGTLSEGGQWTAFLLGTIVVSAGWDWGIVLIAYFAASSLLTRIGLARKMARTESMLPVHTERNARQVIANGGVFAGLVVLGEASGDARFLVAGLGALAAAAADTWATETGTLWGGTPRSIITGRAVEAGQSGGITPVGTAASVVAAALFAYATRWLVPAADGAAFAVLLGGVGGSLGDSVLGATLQSKRWCDQCRTWTERRVHTCQYRTHHASGVRWMNNDTVNLLATVIGAALALAVTLVSAPR